MRKWVVKKALKESGLQKFIQKQILPEYHNRHFFRYKQRKNSQRKELIKNKSFINSQLKTVLTRRFLLF